MARSDPAPNVAPLATFGEALKYLRKRARLTQRQLAQATGYSEAHISYLENNQRLPDVETVAALFIPALELHDAPELAAHLVELAAQARGESLSGRQLSVTYTVEQVTEELEPIPELAPTAGGPARRVMLPVLLTPLVGRDATLAELMQYISAHHVRLLTLTGAPGIGKTSLAQSGGYREAIRLASAADATRSQIGGTVQLTDQTELALALAQAEATISVADFAQAWQAGQRLELEAANSEALVLC